MPVNLYSKPSPVTNYIEPVNQDLFQKAVIYKQQKFEENHKRVQASLDTAANLDIMNQSDKEYLDSKMNDLVSNINKMSGVDLTDFRSAAKLESLSTDITSDERILGSYISTQNIRKGLKQIETFKNSDKLNKFYSPENEAYFLEQTQGYLQDTTGKNKFSGTYTPYTNVHKTLSDELSKIKANSSTDVAGVYFIDNKYVSESEVRRIAQERISTEPAMANQLRISSWYQMKNYTPEQLTKTIYEGERNTLEMQRLAMQQELTNLIADDKANPDKTLKRQKKIEDLQESIKDFSKRVNEFEANPNAKLKAITDNFETEKYRYFTDTMLDGLGLQHSYTEQKVRYNPAPLNIEKFQFDQQYKNNMLSYQYKKLEVDTNYKREMLQLKALELKQNYELGKLGIAARGTTTKKQVGTNPDGTPIMVEINETTPIIDSTISRDNAAQILTEQQNTQKIALKTLLTDAYQAEINKIDDPNIKALFTASTMSDLFNAQGRPAFINTESQIAKARKTGTMDANEEVLLRQSLANLNKLITKARTIWDGGEMAGESLTDAQSQTLAQAQEMFATIKSIDDQKKAAERLVLGKHNMTPEQYKELSKAKKSVSVYISANGVPTSREVSNDKTDLKEKLDREINEVLYNQSKFETVNSAISIDEKNPAQNSLLSMAKDEFLLNMDGSNAGSITGFVRGQRVEVPAGFDASNAHITQYSPITETAIIKTVVDKKEYNYMVKIPKDKVGTTIDISKAVSNSTLNQTDLALHRVGGQFFDVKDKAVWFSTPNRLPLQFLFKQNNSSNYNDHSGKIKIKLNYAGSTVEIPIEKDYPDFNSARAELTRVQQDLLNEAKKRKYTIEEAKTFVMQQLKDNLKATDY